MHNNKNITIFNEINMYNTIIVLISIYIIYTCVYVYVYITNKNQMLTRATRAAISYVVIFHRVKMTV